MLLRKRLIFFVAVSKRGLKSDASPTIEYLSALKELVPHRSMLITRRGQRLLIRRNDSLPPSHETCLMIQQRFATLYDTEEIVAERITTCIMIIN